MMTEDEERGLMELMDSGHSIRIFDGSTVD